MPLFDNIGRRCREWAAKRGRVCNSPLLRISIKANALSSKLFTSLKISQPSNERNNPKRLSHLRHFRTYLTTAQQLPLALNLRQTQYERATIMDAALQHPTI
jgi:hypothetical protein